MQKVKRDREREMYTKYIVVQQFVLAMPTPLFNDFIIKNCNDFYYFKDNNTSILIQ